MSPIVVKPPKTDWRRRGPALLLLALAGLGGYLVTWLIVPPPTMPGHVIVPALRGLPADEVTARLTDLGLLARAGEEIADPGVGPGQVSWQSPAAGTQMPKGAMIQYGLSSGNQVVAVPDLSNLDLSVAQRILTGAGLKLGPIDTVEDRAEVGVVIASRPAAGAAARPGALIALTVSEGAPPVSVPNVIGLTLREARIRLDAVGLRVGQLIQVTDGRAGTIVSQEPAPGSVRPRLSGIDLTISGAPR